MKKFSISQAQEINTVVIVRNVHKLGAILFQNNGFFYGHPNKLDRAYKNIFEKKRVNSPWCRDNNIRHDNSDVQVLSCPGLAYDLNLECETTIFLLLHNEVS